MTSKKFKQRDLTMFICVATITYSTHSYYTAFKGYHIMWRWCSFPITVVEAKMFEGVFLYSSHVEAHQNIWSIKRYLILLLYFADRE